jgi:hypothetical protein
VTIPTDTVRPISRLSFVRSVSENRYWGRRARHSSQREQRFDPGASRDNDCVFASRGCRPACHNQVVDISSNNLAGRNFSRYEFVSVSTSHLSCFTLRAARSSLEVNWEAAVAARRLKFSSKLAAALSVSIISSASKAYTPEQQQLCSNDAIRLCSSDIPDVDRITVCMSRQRNLLSPACKAFFPTDEAKKTKKPAGAS